jgi:predicted ATPase
VPLQSVRDAELVQPTVARALGRGNEDTLLVLDNFEQVLAAASRVADLLAEFPKLKLLVTSREALHIGAEHEYPVAPLREREAVALFMERATAAKPDFAEDEALVEICRRLDCLPLALELAAARVKALSTEQLLSRLDRRLPMLTGGPRDAPERQQTLRATIAWSYDLLAPGEQRAFARLAVFAGGCTLEAAEEVCEAPFDTVAALIDKSLLYREDDRYFMLETIAEYALERLENDGELDEVRRRHAEHYLERARAVERLIRSPQAARAVDELERDHGNLRAALSWLSDETPDQPLRLAVWGLAARLHGSGDLALDLKDALQVAYSIAGLAAVDALQDRLGQAARLWGSVVAFERTSGSPLNEAERQRYVRVLGDVERRSDTADDYAQGAAMTLDEAVEFALASLD